MKQGPLLIALILAACSPSATPSAPPTLPSATVASPAPTDPLPASPIPSPQVNAAVPFPDVSLIAAAATGELHALRSGRWERLAQPCPSGGSTYTAPITQFHVSANGQRAWFQCGVAGPSGDVLRAFVYDVGAKTLREVSGTLQHGLGPISPDGRFAIAHGLGDCPMPAPVCQSKSVLIDLATNTRRDILPSEYRLGMEMRWTAFGLTYFQPECASAGCAGPEKAGTYRWDGTGWTKLFPQRLIEATTDGRMLLERRTSLTDAAAEVAVIERTAAAERVLTQAAAIELGLALDDTGVTAFRPDGQLTNAGVYVRYEGGREVRTTRGEFSSYLHARAAGWIVTVGDRAPTGSSGSTLYAYSLDGRSSATSITPFPIIALAALGR